MLATGSGVASAVSLSSICKAEGGAVNGINCEWWAGTELNGDTLAPEVLMLEPDEDEHPARHAPSRPLYPA